MSALNVSFIFFVFVFFVVKPGSAGVSIREGSHRLLALAMRGEWPPVDQVLKAIEKAVAAGGEDVNSTPLSGVVDPVSFRWGLKTN